MEQEKNKTTEELSSVNSSNVEIRLRRKEFNYLDSAMACVVFIALQILINFVIDILPDSFRQSFSVAFTLSFLVEAVFFFAVIIVSSRRKVEFVEATTINKKPDVYSIILSIVISLVCLFAFSGLTNVFVNVLYKLGYSSSASLTIPNLSVYLLYIFLICIVPAFCEDLLFRGCILSGLRKLGDHKAVIISAVIFMLMHGGPDQTIHQFIIGLVLGYSFIASGTIWVPVVIHFVNNFTALTAAYLTRNVEVVETAVPTWGQIFLQFSSAVISAVIGVYFVYFCIKSLKKIRDKKEAKQTQDTAISENITASDDAKTEEVVEPANKNETIIKEKKLTKIFFIIAGVYLILNWLLALVGGFLV